MLDRQDRCTGLFFVCIVIICCFGCSKEQANLKDFESSHELVSDGTSGKYNLGKVLAGEKRTHLFLFKNTTNENVVTDKDSSVIRSCQCAGVAISPTILAPGDVAEIEMTVDTTTRMGDFNERVAIKWRGDSGKELLAIFELSGSSFPALTILPNPIVFTRDNILADEKIQVTLQSNEIAMDWGSLITRSAINYLDVSDIDVKPSEKEAVFYVAVNKEKVDAGGVHEVTVVVNGVRNDVHSDGTQTPFAGKFMVQIDNPKLLRIDGKSILLTKPPGNQELFEGYFFLEGHLPENVDIRDILRVTVDDACGFSVHGIEFENLADTVVQVSFYLEKTDTSYSSVSELSMEISIQGFLEKNLSLIFPQI